MCRYIQTPTAYDIPVEDHIVGVVKDLLRTKDRTRHTGLVPDLNGTMKIPLKGLKNRLSIQASAPYDTVKNELKQETRLNTLKRMNISKDFIAGGKTQILNTCVSSMSNNDPFMDSWANPLLRRGEIHPAPNISTKAFISSVGGNKSTVLPNDVFDVIADAQETGGAAQRHLGKSSRFGLSENSDFRPTIVHPPLKLMTSSTLKSHSM